MKKIYCISFTYEDDFDKATFYDLEGYMGMDYDNLILEFDNKQDREEVLGKLLLEEVEDYDVFESEIPTYF